MKQKIFQKVRAYIEKYHMIASGDTIVMGVSGGADSVCLFLILCELAEEMQLRLIAVHVNHGIRADDAKADAAYVKCLCEERGIPFVLVERDVNAYARREHLSEEEAGRKVRYQAFEEALNKYTRESEYQMVHPNSSCSFGKIAVAHNANDRAETMLFHLFRGTGLSGASGIKPVRGNIIRPILCLKREEIEEYLRERKISFCIDKTNMEDTYTRNRIRNHIFPFVEKEICQGTVAHMCETADLLAEMENYIRKQAQDAYQRCAIGQWDVMDEEDEENRKVELDVNSLRSEEPFIRRQVLLLGLERVTEGRKDITSVHVKEIERLLDKPGSKQISLPYGLVIRKESLKVYSRLILCREEKGVERLQEGKQAIAIAAPIPGEVEIPGLGKMTFTLLESEKLPPESEIAGFFLGKSQFIPQKSCTKWFDYDRITKSLMFRVRETGDYLTIDRNLSKKKLKDYMIGEKIPRNQREKIYVLAEGSHVLWVPGYRISEYYKITEYTKHILQVQLRGGL